MPGAPQANEGGVDIPLPGGTPIYALATGPLEGLGNFWHSQNLYTPGSGNPGYGVLTERVNVPGLGPSDVYYQHIDLAPGLQTCYAGNCGGQVVRQGQLIGYSRANVGEVEMGINANWGGVWGPSPHPGSWVTDPRGPLKALAGAGPSSTVSTGIDCSLCNEMPDVASRLACQWGCQAGTSSGQAVNQWTGTAALTQHILTNLTTPDFWMRAGLGIFAILLILGAMYLFIKDTKPVQVVQQTTTQAAEVAALA